MKVNMKLKSILIQNERDTVSNVIFALILVHCTYIKFALALLGHHTLDFLTYTYSSSECHDHDHDTTY